MVNLKVSDMNENKKDLATREKILKAAREIFVEKGRDGARMQEIADRAGVNKALLHYYHTSKENLYREIILDAFRELIMNIGQLFEADLSPEEQIKQLIHRHFDFLAKNTDLPRLMMQEFIREDSILPGLMHEVIFSRKSDMPSKLFDFFKKIKPGEKINPQDAIHILLNIIGMNAVYFIARPVVDVIFPDATRDQANFLENRKKIISDMVLKSLFNNPER